MANQSQNSGDPSLCANNCGFFGNPATNNLCSKCYKEHLMVQTKELGDQKMEIKKDDLTKQVAPQKGMNENVEGGSSTSSSSSRNDHNDAENGAPNRCKLCKKKVGLTGFKCRCGQTFCSLHRYWDKHDCVFDYRGAAKDAIARANPVVKADKIDKI